MKFFRKKRIYFSLLTFLLLSSISVLVYAYGNGVANRTLKPGSSPGCTCHQSGSNTAVLSVLTGPDTVVAGSTTNYSFNISRSSGTFSTGGIDIAAKIGTLGIGTSTGIKISSGEVVHSTKFTGVTTKTFTYTAPSTPGIDSLYITGAAGSNPPAWNHGTSKRIVVRSATGIINNETPVSFYLSQNFPNPFNPSTRINYGLAKSSFVNIIIYDITGKRVKELANEYQTAGNYYADFRADNMPSGIYYYRIQAGDFSEVKKMSLIK